MNNLKISIAGLGTVGSSLIELIESNRDRIQNRINKKIIISGICAKNKNKKRKFSIDKYQWFDDPINMINETNPDIFIELMGYEKDVSYNSIKLSLEKKINVITANKALIAHYGNELVSISDNNKTNFLFEASVAGAIPIIKSLKSLLFGNKIIKLSGILNGTTNYILTNMSKNKVSFNEALNDAKNKGYVEANPDLDIEGLDSAHKLSIISSLAFNSKFKEFSLIYKEGISKIDSIDIDFAEKLNFVIKLLAVSEIKNNKISQYVKPLLIDKNFQIAQVNGVLNGIQIITKDSGNFFLEGAGAGGYATSSSIISDIAEISLNSFTPALGINFEILDNLEHFQFEDQYGSFYIRLNVLDKPGVLASITSEFKNNDISIETMIQNPLKDSSHPKILPLIFTTHETYLKNINKCIERIINIQSVKHKPVVIQIYKV